MQCISWENNIYAVHIIINIHYFGFNKMELDASVFLSEDRIAGLFSVPNEIFKEHMPQLIPCQETYARSYDYQASKIQIKLRLRNRPLKHRV